jgi:hypothetical protein
MMEKEELIKQCRYYKGEKECPVGVKASMWNYEMFWFESIVENKDAFKNEIKEMHLYFAQSPSIERESKELLSHISESLLSVLFNRYMHWLGSAALSSFCGWVKNEYLKV